METLEKVYQFALQKNREGIILDTVVLLLFLIGKYSIDSIKSFEPTHNYSKDDYDLLCKIIRPFKKIVVTPQVIAEISNISRQSLSGAKLQQYLCAVIDFFKDRERMEEHHVFFENWNDKSVGRLCSFGFVDMGMFEIAEQRGVPILTDEEDLYNFSKKKIPIIKLSVIKYSNLKKFNLPSQIIAR